MNFFFHNFIFIVIFLFQITRAVAPSAQARITDENILLNKNATEDKLKSKAEQLVNAKPLCFEENKGQVTHANGSPAPEILFKAESPGLIIWVTTQGLTYQFLKYKAEEYRDAAQLKGIKQSNAEKIEEEWSRVDMILKGSLIEKGNIIDGDPVSSGLNYYLAHCPEGILNVKTFKNINIKNVYPGIDWVLKTSDKGGMKYDFIVHPGADARTIKLSYQGNGKLLVTDDQISFENELGQVTEGNLFCYQDNRAKKISSHYSIKENNKIKKGFSYEVGIEIESYDKTHDLVIDPDLQWGTYFGGNLFDGVRGAVADAAGNLFVTGYTNATNFLPLLNSGPSTYYQGTNAGSYDIFLMKFNVNGVLQWSTYYGGTEEDVGLALAIDLSGNVYATGYTISDNFPTFNPGNGAYYVGTNTPGWSFEVYVLKFSNTGARLWATYYGDGVGTASDICVDAAGNIFITGSSEVNGMPVMNPGSGAYYQPSNAGGDDIFILKFTPLGALAWATYYGGTGYDLGYSIDNDASGNIFITGYTLSTNFPTLNPSGGAYFLGTLAGLADAFILKFSNNGTRLWATYYGGSGDEYGNDVAVDATGNPFITGQTLSANFPLQNAGTYFDNTLSASGDIFILKFSNSGVRQWATLYGGNGGEVGYSIATDANGNIFVTGFTSSTDFSTLNPGGTSYFRGTHAGGLLDVFILEFNNNGLRLWATYNGTPQADFGTALATSPSGFLFAAGEWQDPGSNGLNNPGGGAYYNTTLSGADDSFIMKFGIPVSPLPVELISFAADVEENFIHLTWNTASESNNRGFELQRSSDVNNFEKIAWRNGQGNAVAVTEYFYDDTNVQLEEIYYYRLKQIDFDGEENYSAIIAAKITNENLLNFDIFANPAQESAAILWHLPFNSSVEIFLTDVTGKRNEIFKDANVKKGEHFLILDGSISNLTRGIYFVTISIPSQTVTRKLIIQ